MTTETEILPPGAELVAIPSGEALDYFMAPTKIDPILARVRAEIDKWQSPGAETEEGRAAIKAFAWKITKSRTYLGGIGDELAKEIKALPRKVDTTRNHIATTLQKWQDEVREPLTKWEETESRRKEAHRRQLEHIIAKGNLDAYRSATELRMAFDAVDVVVIGPQCEEFLAEYEIAKHAAQASLTKKIMDAEKREAEAAELEALRKEKAERDAKERAEQAERDRQAEIERRAAEMAEAEKRRDQQARDAEEEHYRAECQRKIDEAEKARKEAIYAQERAAATKAAEEQAAAAREADKKHRGAIHRAAAEALFNTGIVDANDAKAIIKSIVTGQIPNVKIEY